jgi:hypothetical protein
MTFALTISTDTDACAGDYDTYLEAVDAADDAAAIDGLTARHGSNGKGFFVDSDGMAWFSFSIAEVAR